MEVSDPWFAARQEIEALREQALSDYRECRGEGSYREAGRYDTVASTLRVVLDILDRAEAANSHE